MRALDRRSWALVLALTSSGPCSELTHERDDAAQAPMDAGVPVPSDAAPVADDAPALPTDADVHAEPPFAVPGVDLVIAPTLDEAIGAVFEYADLDDDGIDDLLVVNHGYLLPATGGARIHSVLVVYGRRERRVGWLSLGDADAELLGTPGPGTYFTLTRTDFDGDAIDDVVIGTPNTNSFRVLYGSRTRLPRRPNIEDVTARVSPDASFPTIGAWGTSASAGDVDGDGHDDLFVTELSYDITGSLAIVHGRAGRLPDASSCVPDTTFVLDPDGRFPTGRALGDIDGDGHDDLLVAQVLGAERRFGVFYGPITASEVAMTDADATLVMPHRTDSLAVYSSFGGFDLTGDGLPDIVVPGDAGALGSVHVFGGSRTRLSGVLGPTDATVSFDGVASRGQAGCGLAAGDADGDGRDELLIGSPELSSAVGRVDRFFRLPTESPFAASDEHWTGGARVLRGVNYRDRLGFALVARGDWDGDGYDDALLGAPSDLLPAGHVFVVYGRPR